MVGAELAVGYVFSWLVRKARRVAGRADAEVDRGLDAGMDHLHELVATKLGPDPALERARQEAAAGQEQPTERTRRRLADSLADAAEDDHTFARALQQALEQLQAAAGAAATRGGVVSAPGGAATGGNVSLHAEGGSAAAMQMRDVTIGTPASPRRPGTDQG